MKVKGLKKGFVWTLCFTLLPQQGVAMAAEKIADFMKADRDVMVRWLPEKDTIQSGEEGVIVLEAGIDASRNTVTAADVEIRLSQEEAGALLSFRDEEGRLDYSEPLFSERGEVPIWLAFTGDDGAVLSFTLDEDSPSLRQELIFQIPVSTTELFDIDVTQEDILVTPYLVSEEERLEKERLLEKKEKKDKKERKEKEEKPQKPEPAGENMQESEAEEGTADTESQGESLPLESAQEGESGESSEELPGEDSENEYEGDESGPDAPPAQESGGPAEPETGDSSSEMGEESNNVEEGADTPEDETPDPDSGSGTESADSGSSGGSAEGADSGSSSGSGTEDAGSGSSGGSTEGTDSGSGSALAKASVQASGLSIAAKSWPRLSASLRSSHTLGITIPVEKIWGMLDADGKLPESVAVGLYRAAAGGDGESAGEPQPVMDENSQPVTLELNRDNGWKGSFGSGSAESGGQDNAEGGQDGAGSGGQAAFNADTFLPRFDAEGNRYLYSVREERIGDAAAEDLREQKAYIIFETNTGTDEAPGWRISNVQPVQIAGTKTWRDEGGANHTRPEALTLKLRRSTDSNAWPGGGSEGSRWTYVSQEDMEREGATLTWEKGNPEKDVWIYTYANLPAADGEGNRYTYSVDEEVPEGYVLTAASPSNATPSQAMPGTATPSYIPGGVDFTNLASNKALKIEGTKTWIDAGGRPADLALTLWRRVSGGEPEEAPGQAPKWQKAGNVWTFTYENLPEFDRQGRKYAYWVTESGVPSSYDVYYDEDGLHLTNVQKGGITVAKTVTGSRGSRDKEFTFTVTMLDTEIYGTMVRGTEIDGVYGGMTFVNGVASFTLKHGQSLTAEGLPGGMNYIVVEMEAGRDGYTTSSSGAMGQIPAGGTAQAVYTNYRGGGSSGGGGGNDPGGHRYVDNSGGGPGISRGGGGKTVSNKGGGGTDSTIPPIIRKDIVKTGDTSNLQRYLLLFAVSLAGLAALLFFGIFRKGGKGRKGRDK